MSCLMIQYMSLDIDFYYRCDVWRGGTLNRLNVLFFDINHSYYTPHYKLHEITLWSSSKIWKSIYSVVLTRSMKCLSGGGSVTTSYIFSVFSLMNVHFHLSFSVLLLIMPTIQTKFMRCFLFDPQVKFDSSVVMSYF